MRAAHLWLSVALLAGVNAVHAQDGKEQAKVAALSEGLYACLLIIAPNGSEIAKLADPLPPESIIETAKAIVRFGRDTRADWEFEASTTGAGPECSGRTVTYGTPEVEFRHIEPALAALQAMAGQRGVTFTQSGEIGSRVWSVGGVRIEEYRGSISPQHSVSFTVKRAKQPGGAE
jgi:hypothetical protein